MAGANVVDELVVKLTLDSSGYKKADKEVDQVVTNTEKKRKKEADARVKRDKEQIKRTKELTAVTKGFGVALAAVAAVASVMVGSVVQLAGLETSLRRTAVSTNMSNREMQAWGSTARRLGADAQAGAQAIADLAKEQQQFNLTGNAPTLQAFARLGIRATPETPIADILAQAQQVYRNSSPAQQQQIEAALSAQGVSNDLIVMIKSEVDAREAYNRSLAEAATENRKALDAVYDTLSGLAAASTNIANTFASLLQPAFEAFGKYVSDGAQALSAWNDRVIAAGGGLQGVINVLTDDFPKTMQVVSGGLRVMGQWLDVLAYGAQQWWKVMTQLFDWISSNTSVKGLAKSAGDALANAGNWVAGKWGEIVNKARSEGPAPVQNWLNGSKPQGAAAPGAPTSASDIMQRLITRYGVTVPEAAAIAANVGGESGFNPSAFNPAGGGTGARGLFQWRGARSDAFRKKFGVMPDQASIDQQLEFMMTDPYERSLWKRVQGAGSNAADIGAAFSNVFEAHGNAAETARRSKEAARLADAYGGATPGAGAGTSISIQQVNVQANNVDEFTSSVRRVAGPQNYANAVR